MVSPWNGCQGGSRPARARTAPSHVPPTSSPTGRGRGGIIVTVVTAAPIIVATCRVAGRLRVGSSSLLGGLSLRGFVGSLSIIRGRLPFARILLGRFLLGACAVALAGLCLGCSMGGGLGGSCFKCTPHSSSNQICGVCCRGGRAGRAAALEKDSHARLGVPADNCRVREVVFGDDLLRNFVIHEFVRRCSWGSRGIGGWWCARGAPPGTGGPIRLRCKCFAAFLTPRACVAAIVVLRRAIVRAAAGESAAAYERPGVVGAMMSLTSREC